MSENTNTSHYDQFYTDGDFNCDPETAREWLQTHLINWFQLEQGDRVLDLGCGKGLHSSLLADLGMQVFGVDISPEGIRGANERGSKATFICASASELDQHFDEGYFDLIYCRGMSWFHRELDQVCPQTGVDVREKISEFFRLIKPGGLFVLQICTDFTGSRPANEVHNNRLSDYIDLFTPHGELVHVSNWLGTGLYEDEQAVSEGGTGIVIATKVT